MNDKGEDGWTPIFRACYNNRLELAQFLAEHGANLGRNADDFENTPLHACCINGHREVRYGGGCEEGWEALVWAWVVLIPGMDGSG